MGDTAVSSVASAISSVSFVYSMIEINQKRQTMPRMIADRLDRWMPVLALVQTTQTSPGSLERINFVANFQQQVLKHLKAGEFDALDKLSYQFIWTAGLFSRAAAKDADAGSETKRANSVTAPGAAAADETSSILSSGTEHDGITSPRQDSSVAPFGIILASLQSQLPELMRLLVDASGSREESDRLENYVQDSQALFNLASQCGGDMKALYQAAAPLIQYWNLLRTRHGSQKTLIPSVYRNGVLTHCQDADEREQSHQKLFYAVAKALHHDADHVFPGLDEIVSSWKPIVEFKFSEFRFLGDELPFMYIYARLLGGRSRIIRIHYDSEDPDKIVFTEDEKVPVRAVQQKFQQLCKALAAPPVTFNRKQHISARDDFSDASDEEAETAAEGEDAVDPSEPQDADLQVANEASDE